MRRAKQQAQQQQAIVLECEDSGTCERRTATSVGLPSFITIDFDKQLLHATAQQDKTSPLNLLEHINDRLVLHGSEEGRGWTIVITEDTGTMSAAVAGYQIGFVVFGALHRPEEVHSILRGIKLQEKCLCTF